MSDEPETFDNLSLFLQVKLKTQSFASPSFGGGVARLLARCPQHSRYWPSSACGVPTSHRGTAEEGLCAAESLKTEQLHASKVWRRAKCNAVSSLIKSAGYLTRTTLITLVASSRAEKEAHK